MGIATSRTRESAIITIDVEKCNGCGKCVDVCKDFGIKLMDEKAYVSGNALFGCIACGHCVAVCPQKAISISGRTLSPEDIFELPPLENVANYHQLLALLQRRRSIREFTDKAVDSEIIDKIIEAAKTSPMGIPPSEVNLLIFDSREKNYQFAQDFCIFLQSIQWMVSKWFMFLMRPFWGKATDEFFKSFFRPALYFFTEEMKKGNNYITYDAPLAIYFYGSPYCDPADPLIAATTAMYAAESLGLGTCMIGSVHPLIQYGTKTKKLREKYNIKCKSREGIFVIFGYPAVRYKSGIKRTFASTTFAD